MASQPEPDGDQDGEPSHRYSEAMSSHALLRSASLALLTGIAACGAAPAADPAPAAPASERPTPRQGTAASASPAPALRSEGRVVAVGDLHADLDDALAVLRMAGLIDASAHWSGGRAVLVQTGDTTDRGPDSKEVIELLQRLGPEAEAAGGRVVALLGNHEAMNLTGDLRYVSPLDVADFGSPAARAQAFGPQGALGSWLLDRDVVQKVDDTVYAHGGVSPAWAARGLGAINDAARAALRSDPRAAVLGPEGPLWLRDYLLADEALACPQLQRALDALGARRMVVGHTTQRSGRIAVRCGGALLGIDTGISSHYGDNHAALEILAGDARALYPAGPEDLPDPQ